MTLFLATFVAAVAAGTVFVYVRTRALSRETTHGQLDLTPETIAELPDRIQLTPLAPAAELPAAVVETAREFLEQGFEDAGAFVVQGLPATRVRLLAHRAHSMYVALWSREDAGTWLDVS